MSNIAEIRPLYGAGMVDKKPLATADTTINAALSDKDLAVLRVLFERQGKVTDRASLNKLAGLTGTPRRCETILVTLRKALGNEAIVTIRRRGWMLRSSALPIVSQLLDTAGR